MLARDKLLHIIVGLLIYSFARIFVLIEIALIITAFIAVIKEIYDRINSDKHTPEIADALATFIIPGLLFIIEFYYVNL